MNKLVLDCSMATDVTMVSNFFIDEYMPRANGDFVKIYLHLLRLINSCRRDFDLNAIADIFNFTERDILRAFRYWESLGLLSISRGEDNAISGIRLDPLKQDMPNFKGVYTMPASSSQNNNSSSIQNEATPVVIPAKKRYSPEQIQAFKEKSDFDKLSTYVEDLSGRLISSKDTNILIYMYDALSFSPEFIKYIIDECFNKNHKSMAYVEKVAQSYYQRGINSLSAAESTNSNTSSLGAKVLNAFGITGRLPGQEESSYIIRWQEEYGFSEDMIIEACNRTLSHTHTPSFKYVNSILASWHKSGAKNINDIEELDKIHNEENKKKYEIKKAAGVNQPKHKGGHNISGRTYDYDALERELLNRR